MTADYRPTPPPVSAFPLSMQGRLSRLSYIGWYGLLNILLILALLLFGFILMPVALQSGLNNAPWSLSGELASSGGIFIIGLAYLYFNLVLVVRRLHDRDHSGWGVLFLLIPVVNFLFVLYLLLAPGDPWVNRFGAPRPAAGWEKLLAWLMIAVLILSFFASRSVWLELGQSQPPLELPREVLHKATPYF